MRVNCVVLKFIIKTGLMILIVSQLSGCFELDTPWPDITCEPVVSKYERDEFSVWSDIDDDGEDTRAEVLIDRSKVAVVTYTNEGEVTVVSGEWYDSYTGKTFTQASELDIDHVVPLKEAWVSGACRWDRDKKNQFGNELGDVNHLLAVDSSENRSKGDRDPANWLPSNRGFVSEYLKIWVKIKVKWGLTADKGEYDYLSSNTGLSSLKLTTCPCE